MFKKKITGLELKEIQEIHTIVQTEKFKLAQIKGNMALIPNGRALVNQLEATTKLFQDIETRLVSERLKKFGFPEGMNVSMDVKTGIINHA